MTDTDIRNRWDDDWDDVRSKISRGSSSSLASLISRQMELASETDEDEPKKARGQGYRCWLFTMSNNSKAKEVFDILVAKAKELRIEILVLKMEDHADEDGKHLHIAIQFECRVRIDRDKWAAMLGRNDNGNFSFSWGKEGCKLGGNLFNKVEYVTKCMPEYKDRYNDLHPDRKHEADEHALLTWFCNENAKTTFYTTLARLKQKVNKTDTIASDIASRKRTVEQIYQDEPGFSMMNLGKLHKWQRTIAPTYKAPWIDPSAKKPWVVNQTLEDWIEHVKDKQESRKKCLFVCGPTRLGKSEWIKARLVAEGGKVYYNKGRFNLDTMLDDGKFLIFDDIKWPPLGDQDMTKSVLCSMGPVTLTAKYREETDRHYMAGAVYITNREPKFADDDEKEWWNENSFSIRVEEKCWIDE